MMTLTKTGLALAAALSLSACASNGRDDRALTGAAIGGVAGAVIGGAATGRAGGAVAGGLIGAAGGAIIGASTTPQPRYRPRCYIDEYGQQYCQ